MQKKYLFIVLYILLVVQNAFSQQQGYQHFLPTHKAIHYMGRIDFSNPLRPAFWQPGVTIDCVFKGDSCGIILEDEIKWGSNHNYIEVVLTISCNDFELKNTHELQFCKYMHIFQPKNNPCLS